jgi:hypothetical protein
MGIVVIGEDENAEAAVGAPNVIIMISGSTWARSVTGAVRATCAGTSTTAGLVNNVTAATTACAGRVVTNASSGTPAVLVQVAPN